MALHLYVPDEREDEEIIESYHQHIFEKYREFDPTVSREDISIDEKERRAVERFHETGNVEISYRGWADYAATEAWDEFFDLLEAGTQPETGHGSRPITDERKLQRLIALLREMKAELKAMDGGPERSDGLEFTPEDREREFEVGPVALVEFARENGYGVTMDY